jgi:hypothetical protein
LAASRLVQRYLELQFLTISFSTAPFGCLHRLLPADKQAISFWQRQTRKQQGDTGSVPLQDSWSVLLLCTVYQFRLRPLSLNSNQHSTKAKLGDSLLPENSKRTSFSIQRPAHDTVMMDRATASLPTPTTPHSRRFNGHMSRMQYRRRPVSVAVDPISLVISECIAITSSLQKYARSQHSSVSAILGGGGPNLLQLGPNPSPRRSKNASRPGTSGDAAEDGGSSNRWGLRGQKGKSMQDNPLISGFARLRQDLTGVQGGIILQELKT